MSTNDDNPTPRVVFWPVNCGDSTSVVLSDDIVMQVDLHHLESSPSEDTPATPVLDELAEVLPEDADGLPYLAVAAFTHLDDDHCRGAGELLDRFTVGELWVTPRSFVEAEEQGTMCKDGEALHAEALRRLAEVLKHGDDTPSGDRMRIIGYDDVLDDLGFADYPDELKSIPGTTVTVLDGQDVADIAEVFIHSPFRDDCGGTNRNASSLGMRITLIRDDDRLRVMLLGDLDHEVLGRLLDVSDDDDVTWDVFLALHHCSKSAVIDDEGNEVVEVTERLEDTKLPGAWVVASSPPFPASDSKGANPPHRAAREIYERIVGADHFICTGENGDEDAPSPVIFTPGTTAPQPQGRTNRLVAGAAAGAALVGAAALIGRAIRPGDRTVPRGDRRFA
jgi:hypothetical protein